ncbi:MAG: response regulator [Candidatus Omnitrophota bacterium]
MSKILIIEDEQDLARALRRQLVDRKFEVICAYDAYQGLKLAQDNVPDLIILDLMLPAGGGLGTLKNIKMSAKTGHVPVIVLTGMKNDELKKKVKEEGVEAYLEKPYDINELVGVISGILQGKG